MERKEENYWQKFLENTNDCYAILQINDDAEHLVERRLRLFSNLKEIKRLGIPAPHMDQYHTVYSDGLDEFDPSIWENKKETEAALESLYMRFNIYLPENFHGHSLSVSDVVAIKVQGKIRFFFVDSIGFSELENFC